MNTDLNKDLKIAVAGTGYVGCQSPHYWLSIIK